MKNHKEQLKTNSNTLGQQNREGGYAPTLEINAWWCMLSVIKRYIKRSQNYD